MTSFSEILKTNFLCSLTVELRQFYLIVFNYLIKYVNLKAPIYCTCQKFLIKIGYFHTRPKRKHNHNHCQPVGLGLPQTATICSVVCGLVLSNSIRPFTNGVLLSHQIASAAPLNRAQNTF